LIQNAIVRLKGQETVFEDVEEPVKIKDYKQHGGIPLKNSEKHEFERFLSTLTTSRVSICEGMIRAIELAPSSREVVDIICDSLLKLI
jgi:hypothetical protein